MRHILAILLFLAQQAQSTAILPSTRPGLIFWANSSDITGTTATVWPLRVGGTMTTSNTISVNVSDSGLHGKQTISFDSGELFTQSSSIAAMGTGDRSIFWCSYPFATTGAAGDVILATPNTAGTNCRSHAISDTNFWGWGTGDIGSLTAYGNAGGTTYQVMQFMISAGGIYRWTNNTVKTSGTSFGCNDTPTGAVAIGSWQGRNFVGRFSEALIYNRFVTEDERKGIVEYLLYGMATGNRSPYLKNALKLKFGSWLPWLFFHPTEAFGQGQSAVGDAGRVAQAMQATAKNVDALKWDYAVKSKTVITPTATMTPVSKVPTATATRTPSK